MIMINGALPKSLVVSTACHPGRRAASPDLPPLAGALSLPRRRQTSTGAAHASTAGHGGQTAKLRHLLICLNQPGA